MRAAVMIAGLGAWCVGITGCSGTAAAMSKNQYITRAETICRVASEAVHNITPDASSADSVATSIGKVVTVERAAARQLRSLRPPSGDAPALGRWLNLVDDALDQLDASRLAASEGDANAATAANLRSSALQQQADDVALRYGVAGCVAPR